MNVFLLFMLFPRTMKRLFLLVVLFAFAMFVWTMAASEGGNVDCMTTPSAPSCVATDIR